MTEGPVITDEEADMILFAMAVEQTDHNRSFARAALSAFLKARVPKKQLWGAIEADEVGGDYEAAGEYDSGFNDCIDAVLRGKAP